MPDDAQRSLQDLIEAIPDLVDYMFNHAPGAHSRTRADQSPVPVEFTNWRDEQRSWREAAVLFDQSHHMPELFLSGLDARALITKLAVNSMANLEEGRAKQFVACNDDGLVIGDCIIYVLPDGVYELVSGMPVLNWVEYHATKGDYDVQVRRDNSTAENKEGRTRFRFQLDGPRAAEILDDAVEGDSPELPFFRTASVTIAGAKVLLLRHGMAGHKGVELSGAYEDGQRVWNELMRVGKEYGLQPGGTKAYFSTMYESGWLAYPLPAIYTSEALRPYREWLPADGWEGRFQFAGSYEGTSLEDYYMTPYDLGYGHIVKFDHDFVGREALERLAQDPPRRKVTLVWNSEDVVAVMASLFGDEVPYKYLELPVSDYGSLMQRDAVFAEDGTLVGVSTYCGYSGNERKFLSLAVVDAAAAEPGTEVTILWGEKDGGSRKPRVELHRQTNIRATVAPAPYAAAVQAMKRTTVGAAQ